MYSAPAAKYGAALPRRPKPIARDSYAEARRGDSQQAKDRAPAPQRNGAPLLEQQRVREQEARDRRRREMLERERQRRVEDERQKELLDKERIAYEQAQRAQYHDVEARLMGRAQPVPSHPGRVLPTPVVAEKGGDDREGLVQEFLARKRAARMNRDRIVGQMYGQAVPAKPGFVVAFETSQAVQPAVVYPGIGQHQTVSTFLSLEAKAEARAPAPPAPVLQDDRQKRLEAIRRERLTSKSPADLGAVSPNEHHDVRAAAGAGGVAFFANFGDPVSAADFPVYRSFLYRTRTNAIPLLVS